MDHENEKGKQETDGWSNTCVKFLLQQGTLQMFRHATRLFGYRMFTPRCSLNILVGYYHGNRVSLLFQGLFTQQFAIDSSHQ